MNSKEARELVIGFAENHKSIPEIKWITENTEKLRIKEHGEGLINFVFAVTSEDEKHSVILKHAKEYAKFNQEEKMPLERQILEFNALSLLQQISPGCVPKPYCLDSTFNIIAMENLGHMYLMGTQLTEQKIDQEGVKKCGQVLAMLHKKTLKANNTAVEWEELEKKFRNNELRDINRTYLLERCLVEDDSINDIPPEALSLFRKIVKDPEVISLFKALGKAFSAEDGCVILADCYWNGIFLKDGRCALFDMEFTYIGHPAVNLAMTMVGFLLFPLSLETPDWNEYTTAARNFIEAYFKESEDSVGDMIHTKNLIPTLAAFSGVTLFEFAILRQISDLARVITTSAQIEMMKRGMNILKLHASVTDVDSFLQLFFQESGK